MLIKSIKYMVPWLAELSWIKIIVFIYICGYVWVYMNDGPYVWVLAFIKSARVFFKILATTCRIDKRKSHAFSFESFW